MVSVNQVRHFFVVKDVKTGTNPVVNEGDVKVCNGANGVYLQYMGRGGLITSDYIKPGNLISITETLASEGEVQLKEAKLQLTSSLVAGADYIVDVMISNYIAMADESTLVKFGAVHATSSMSTSEFYVALAKSLARNFSRDINKFFKIYVTYGTSYEEVTTVSNHDSTTNTYDAVVIAEQAQTADYVRGEFSVLPVNFRVVPHTIIDNGDEVCPFRVDTDSGVVVLNGKNSRTGDTVISISNGYELADTEYFCMGERGDMYRQMGYPRTIRTKYMVDETEAYDVLDVAFYFLGRGVDVQKSEKLLTLVEESGNGKLTTIKTSIESYLV